MKHLKGLNRKARRIDTGGQHGRSLHEPENREDGHRADRKPPQLNRARGAVVPSQTASLVAWHLWYPLRWGRGAGSSATRADAASSWRTGRLGTETTVRARRLLLLLLLPVHRRVIVHLVDLLARHPRHPH